MLIICIGYSSSPIFVCFARIKKAPFITTFVPIGISFNNVISLKPTTAYKSFLKKILLSNQENDYYWTNAWEDYWKNPSDKDLKSILDTRLRAFYKNILQLDEYNLH